MDKCPVCGTKFFGSPETCPKCGMYLGRHDETTLEPIPTEPAAEEKPKQKKNIAAALPIILFFIVWCGFAFMGGIAAIAGGAGAVAVMPFGMCAFGICFGVFAVKTALKSGGGAEGTAMKLAADFMKGIKVKTSDYGGAWADTIDATLTINHFYETEKEDLTDEIAAWSNPPASASDVAAELAALPARFNVQFSDEEDMALFEDVLKELDTDYSLSRSETAL